MLSSTAGRMASRCRRLLGGLLRFADLLLQALQLALQHIDLTLQSLGLSVLARRLCRHERSNGESSQHQYLKSAFDCHHMPLDRNGHSTNEALNDLLPT